MSSFVSGTTFLFELYFPFTIYDLFLIIGGPAGSLSSDAVGE